MPASTAGIIIFTVEMLDLALMSSIAQQMMTSLKVQVRGKLVSVRRTSAQRLRSVTFAMNGREYEAIEQNPEKPSRWGQLAREGHQVVQFKDNETGKFIAVVVDGKVRVYDALRRDKH
jgi:hypothetical protein